MPGELPIFTVGHSTRSIQDFVEVLRQGPVQKVIDVRTVPKSRRNPQFGEDRIEGELGRFQIGYGKIADLGGLRGRSHEVSPEVNAFWKNQSFHNYADYALSQTFRSALAQLMDESSERMCAVMCAEAVWWRCHRRIISDYLLASGRTVLHLMGPNRVETARLTPGAKPRDDGIVYPKPSPPDLTLAATLSGTCGKTRHPIRQMYNGSMK